MAHGFTSAGLFRITDFIYSNSHSRRIIINKRLGDKNREIIFLWFILLAINFGAPFTINLVREILLITGTISVSIIFTPYMCVIMAFSLIYCILIYSSSIQGKTQFFFRRFLSISNTHKISMYLLILPGLLLNLFFQI